MTSCYLANNPATLPTLVCHCLALLLLIGQPLAAQTNTPEWKFVSSPDWTNNDIGDLSGNTPGIPAAPGWDLDASEGRNGITPDMEAVYGQLASEMAAHGPELFAVAGDHIAGVWWSEAFLDMFAPESRIRAEGIEVAAGIYYAWNRRFIAQFGLSPLLGTVGDHEIGDDNWNLGDEKSAYVPDMRAAFARHLVTPLGLSGTLRGVPLQPEGTDFAGSSYAYQHRNVLFVSVDVFRHEAGNIQLHPVTGTVSADVRGDHLAWVEAILAAADAEPSIDHVIVQVHTPVLGPVRIQSSSGLMLEGRETSEFWQTLVRHDQRRGGKVRMLFAGEVHAPSVTQSRESDIVQVVHGSSPAVSQVTRMGFGNYVVFTVRPRQIDGELFQFDLEADGSSLHWTAEHPEFLGVTSASPIRPEGRLSIDVRGIKPTVNATGWLSLSRPDGLALHFTFDESSASGPFANTGSLGDLFYEGTGHGGLQTVEGLLGRALRFNGSDAFVESGRGNPTGSDNRAVTAWVRLEAGTTCTLLSYGSRRERLPTWFEVRIRSGELRLSLGPDSECIPAGVPVINDGAWHHVAVVVPRAWGNECRDVEFYVDGARYTPSSSAPFGAMHTVPWKNIRIGVNNKVDARYFRGDVDDLGLWGAGLSSGEVRAIRNAGLETALSYSAADMDKLLAIYRDGEGEVVIGSRTWVPAGGLSGLPGDVLETNGRYVVVFAEDGRGVAEEDGPITEVVYDAENASLSGGFAINDRYAGYTGTGYVEFRDKASAVWTVSVATAGIYELGFRYAVGIDDRRIEVAVDGDLVSGVSLMPSTGAWTQWGEVVFDRFLAAGTHSVRLYSPNLRGPNVDHLFVRGEAGLRLVASPASLQFTVAEGSGASDPQSLRIEASDAGTGPVELFTSAAWIDTDPVSGTLPLTGVDVRVDPGALAAGVYEGEVIAIASGYAEVRVAVAMTVAGGSEPLLYEAELAELSGIFAINDRYAGYTGTGYVEFRDKASAVWTVSVATAGTYELGFRYAVGIDDRKIAVAVDGDLVSGVSLMPSTGAWTQWGEVVFDRFLAAGTHSVRLYSPNLRGPNVDHLRLTPVP